MRHYLAFQELQSILREKIERELQVVKFTLEKMIIERLFPMNYRTNRYRRHKGFLKSQFLEKDNSRWSFYPTIKSIRLCCKIGMGAIITKYNSYSKIYFDELRISKNIARSDAWISNIYANHQASSTLYFIGSNKHTQVQKIWRQYFKSNYTLDKLRFQRCILKQRF